MAATHHKSAEHPKREHLGHAAQNYPNQIDYHTLTAYSLNPHAVEFDSQAKNEKVILLLRQHPIVLFKSILFLIGGILFPVLLPFTPFLDFLPVQFHIAFVVGWLVACGGLGLQIFLNWFFNVYLVTDERIIDVDFLSIVSKNISTAKIENIEDVTFNTQGAFASFFDFGTITVQTAAEKNQFEFDNVPHPSRVAALLNELILEEEQEKLEGRVS